MKTIETISELIACYKKLPGVGNKTAERLAYATLKLSKDERDRFIQSFLSVDEKVRCCPTCGTYFEDKCPICSDEKRDHSTLLVVSDSKDIMSLERTESYLGMYFSLKDTLSPMKNKTPEDIGITALKERVINENIKEVILALPTSLEGETTSLYITKTLSDIEGVVVSRLAYGIPVGTDLEYLDELTISQSLKGRVTISGDKS